MLNKNWLTCVGLVMSMGVAHDALAYGRASCPVLLLSQMALLS